LVSIMVVFGDGKWSRSIANRAFVLQRGMRGESNSLGHEGHEAHEEPEAEAGAFNAEGAEEMEIHASISLCSHNAAPPGRTSSVPSRASTEGSPSRRRRAGA
jgi:hypothetical protein